MDLFNKYSPLMGFYIPSSWFVMKNNMFDIDPSDLINIKSKDELSQVKDYFFCEDLFISRTEYPLSTSEEVIAVVSIGCRFFDEDCVGDIPVCFYDVDFYFKKNGKGSPNIYHNESLVTNRFDAIKRASLYMKIFSHYITPALSSGYINDDLHDYINGLDINWV